MLFKLFNNTVYDEIMENVRKRVNVKLVNEREGRYGCEAYIAEPNFGVGSTRFIEDTCLPLLLSLDARTSGR